MTRTSLLLAMLLALPAAHGATMPAATPALVCSSSEAGLAEKNLDKLTKSLEASLAKGFGADWVRQSGAKRAAKQVAPQTMADIVKLAGCAAMMDVDASCNMFFDPEFSTTLGVFTDLPRSAPARKQFDAAVAAQPDGKEKRATLACMKLVARQ